MSEEKEKKSTRKSTENNNDILGMDLSPRWYVVQTYVGFEDAVRRVIEQKIQNLGIQDKILEVYIPQKKVIKLNKKNERQEKLEKVYPGYIYLNMILDQETGYLIQNTQYVSRIAGTGEFAVPLEEGYVENIKKKILEEDEEQKTDTKVIYQIGDLVKVMEGPFKDMQGKVCGVQPDQSRVSVLLSIFDRETEVDLDVLEVKKVIE